MMPGSANNCRSLVLGNMLNTSLFFRRGGLLAHRGGVWNGAPGKLLGGMKTERWLLIGDV
jgi:hypothetical protein